MTSARMGEPASRPEGSIIAAVERITSLRVAAHPERALLVGISGIDGSGKGYIAARLESALAELGLRVANINVDPWLHLPDRRFDPRRPGEHFYESGIRFDELFERLVLPLRARRRIRVTFDAADATNAQVYRPTHIGFEDIDVVLLEGVFLFRRALRGHFDLAIWIDCSFETALWRALRRGQEALPPEAVVRDYETIYFAAQRIHLERDDPAAFAHVRLDNDARQ